MQAPKIDNRTFHDLVAQAEVLAQIATDNHWQAGAAEYVAAENLAGRVLDQDIVARLVAPAGTKIDETLAEQLRAALGSGSIMVLAPETSALAQAITVADGELAGYILAEDVLVWASNDGHADAAKLRIVLARGMFVSEAHVRGVLALAPGERIRVRAQPPNSAGDLGGALMRVFGRFSELLIDRLNQVPDKHFLSFLNLIGVELLPPRPARAPLQFRLVTGSPIEAVVPAGTRIAAPPLSGEENETVFETERDLVVTRAQLVEAYTRSASHDPDHDSFRRVTPQIIGLDPAPFEMFAGNQEIEHVLYLACDTLLRLPGLADVAIDLTTPDAALFPQLPLAWSYWNGVAWQPIAATSATWYFRHGFEWQPLAHPGEQPPANAPAACRLVLSGIPAVAETVVNGMRGGWLRASLELPVFPAQERFVPEFTAPGDERPRADNLPLSVLSGAGGPRTFYLSSSAGFGTDGAMVALDLGFQQPGISDEVELLWEYQATSGVWQELGRSAAGRESVGTNEHAFTDGTRALTLPGQVRFRIPLDGSWNETIHQERTGRWLRVSVLAGGYRTAPILLSLAVGTTMELPRVEQISMAILTAPAARFPHAAFSDTTALDVSKAFWPFGETPGIGATFYVAYGVAYECGASAGDWMEIRFGLRGGVAGGTPRTGDQTPHNSSVMLRWEYWNGTEWVTLWTFFASADSEVDGIQGTTYADQTRALTLGADLQPPDALRTRVGFLLPAGSAPCAVNGVTDYWVRATIVAGGYGRPATYQSSKKVFGGVELTIYEMLPASYRPPVLQELVIAVQPAASLPVAACVSYNDFNYRDHSAALASNGLFAPFRPTVDTEPALYLGFDRSFEQRLVTLYAQVVAPQAGDVSYANLGSVPYQRPQLAWEYAAGPADAWAPLDVFDETNAFTNRGLAQFIGPPDIARRERFGHALYWLRIRVSAGRFSVMPRLQQLATNTTWASQAITVHDELLGSGTGNAGLTVQLAQRPVLPGLLLDIREPDLPADTAPGPDAIVDGGADAGIWVRWQPVPDFHGSRPRDRHYALDSDSGAIRFGDGLHGMAPPPGQNNIRATRYRSGGGVTGNRAAGTIVELKTSLPYIDGVANIEAAFGGAERQSLESAKRYGPRILRHRGRAVTADDIEDLAYAASADIARARVIMPRFDPLSLYLDPRIVTSRHSVAPNDPGTVGVVIVPQDDSPRPTPTLGLLEDVRAYLLERCAAGAHLWVAGPDWVEVVVRTTVVATSLREADAVRLRVLAALERYLHPLTGGARATGWAFSRIPYPSELYALLKGVAGVDHVRELEVGTPSVEGAIPPTALIYSGTHQVRLAER